MVWWLWWLFLEEKLSPYNDENRNNPFTLTAAAEAFLERENAHSENSITDAATGQNKITGHPSS